MREIEQQERRRVPRVSRSVFAWGTIGATSGLVLGLIIGSAFTTPGRSGFWMAVLGSTIFLGAVCAFTAGIASLGSPPPGEEPPDASASDTDG
jgi:hypothetical protein